MPEIDVFVPKEQEEAYLADHHLQRYQLANRATIFTGLREVDDAAFAGIEFKFPRGTVYDPPGKRGFVHLFEHFVATEAAKAANTYKSDFNAYTSTNELYFELSGIANPRVRNYGVWPVLPVMSSELINIRQVGQTRLSSEQNVILEEMAKNLAAPDRPTMEHLLQVIYGPNNPLGFITTKDQQAQVGNVTLADIALYANRIVHPAGLVARIYVEGPKDIEKLLTDQFRAYFDQLSGSEQPLSGFDPATFSQTNPDTKTGQSYLRDHGIRNNQINTQFVWARESQPFSPDEFADNCFFTFFERQAFHALRARGLIYVGNKLTVRPGNVGETRASAISVKTQKTTGWEDKIVDMASIIKDEVLANITDDELLEMLNINRMGTVARPISIRQRLKDCYDGLILWGKLIDTDKVNEIWEAISLKDMKEIRDRFISTPPITIVTGDLS